MNPNSSPRVSSLGSPLTGTGGGLSVEAIIATGAFTALGVLLLGMGILLGTWPLVLAGSLLAAVALTVTYVIRRRRQGRAVAEIQVAIRDALSKQGLKGFELEAAALGLPPNGRIVHDAAMAVFKEACHKAVGDLVITSREREMLGELRESLGLSESEATVIELRATRSRCELETHLANCLPTERETCEPQRITASLGRGDKEPWESARADVLDLYRACLGNPSRTAT